MFRLDGRVAVVTGACGKLGPIWTGALAGAGARVACLDLEGVAPPSPLSDLLRSPGGKVRLYAADITDRDSLERAARAVEDELGAVGVLVNNAGVDQPPGTVTPSRGGPVTPSRGDPVTPSRGDPVPPSRGDPARTYRVEDIPWETNRKVLEVNLLGLFLATQVFLPSLRRAGGASVVNIGSLYGLVSPDARLYEHLPADPPFLKPPFYGASKAGVSSLGRWLATHLAADGVRVNTLHPGGVLGAQDEEFKRKFCARVPLGRMAEAGDLAGPLLFLASDASRYVTGQDLVVDGGFTAW